MNNKTHTSETQWVSVGRVQSAHGLKGELRIQIFSGETTWAKELTQTKLTLNPQSQSKKNIDQLSKNQGLYEFDLIKPFKEGLKVKLKGVDDRTQADGFVNLLFHIPNGLLVSKPGDDIYLREVLHFKVEDHSGNNLGLVGVTGEVHEVSASDNVTEKNKSYVVGEVVEFLSSPMQDIIKVKRPDESICEIPFVEAFIINIDFEKKLIKMNLPEGLLDL